MPGTHLSDDRDLSEAWATLPVILSNCLKHPDDDLRAAIEDGILAADLAAATSAVGLEEPPSPPSVADRDHTEDYESLFGAFSRPFAPPAASPYKEWYGDSRSGLMGGPPATRMEQRYDAIEASIPPAYPPDHVALELEFASLLAESGRVEDLATFVETELDWIEAFAVMVSEAAADAPFHRFCVDVLVTVVEELRSVLGISDPADGTIEEMTARVRPNVT
jgi:TorA maturation chaperone TorD